MATAPFTSVVICGNNDSIFSFREKYGVVPALIFEQIVAGSK